MTDTRVRRPTPMTDTRVRKPHPVAWSLALHLAAVDPRRLEVDPRTGGVWVLNNPLPVAP